MIRYLATIIHLNSFLSALAILEPTTVFLIATAMAAPTATTPTTVPTTIPAICPPKRRC